MFPENIICLMFILSFDKNAKLFLAKSFILNKMHSVIISVVH
jgi:hypothetical protein